MSRFEIFLTMVIVTIDTLLLMSLTTGGTISNSTITVILFANGIMIGDSFYVLVLQDAVRKKFKKDEKDE